MIRRARLERVFRPGLSWLDLSDRRARPWPAYLGDPARQVACLQSILRLGFVILRDVPRELGTVLQVAESFGFVRETNYGRLFDLRVKPSPNNLAFTGLTITPHTDN